ncbi:Aminotransferase-like, plant mobile domain-containing protein [Cynara cardunculus var. scolymus]|uniref:Aminotransferase-like, plant mobile domain-containing protein n=1 Tax=Cynara cardunculus var. scolymus TaxID=59895 RepID=A0A103YJM4_CYNCS|nr:Aminotransferase-like, plant mobile domain-containing protein [Cynara cardunculus var. scolymus]
MAQYGTLQQGRKEHASSYYVLCTPCTVTFARSSGSVRFTFLTRTNPSILHPASRGAGLFALSAVLPDLSSKDRIGDSNEIGATKFSIVCRKEALAKRRCTKDRILKHYSLQNHILNDDSFTDSVILPTHSDQLRLRRINREQKQKKELERYTERKLDLMPCSIPNIKVNPDFKNKKNLTAIQGLSRKGKVGDGLDEELERWVRCLRVSELVGIDGKCIELYRPHRVAMQFGMDQDMHDDVPEMNDSSEIAWRFYDGQLRMLKCIFHPKFVSQM